MGETVMAPLAGSKRYCQTNSLAKVKVSRSNRNERAQWSGGGPIVPDRKLLRVALEEMGQVAGEDTDIITLDVLTAYRFSVRPGFE